MTPPDRKGLAGEPLRVLQLTDTHLYSDPATRLLGQNTRRTFELVVDAAMGSLSSVDFILLTGDLVHDDGQEAYLYLRRRLEALETPYYCLPGNHDQPALLASIFDTTRLASTDTTPGCAWNIVLLDSTIPGEHGGHLDSGQLELLQGSLAARKHAPTLVCLHHQPVPIGSAWIDTMALDNPQDFFGILDRHPQVRAVIWGHIHQEFSQIRNGVRLLGSPSTCVQFLPNSADFGLDALTPGYRWLTLYPDGRLETGVGRIPAYPDPLELTDCGYD